jgi:hypothetical protein
MNNEHGRSNSNITELDETNVDAVLDVVLLVEDIVKEWIHYLHWKKVCTMNHQMSPQHQMNPGGKEKRTELRSPISDIPENEVCS